MFCKNCGKILLDNAQFCKYCGIEHNITAEQGHDDSSRDAFEDKNKETHKQEASHDVSASQIGKRISSLKIGGLVTGLVLVASAVIYTVLKKPDYSGEFARHSSTTKISNESFTVALTNDFGEKSYEKLLVKADFDKGNNILYFGNYTEDYDRKNWKGTKKDKLPIPYRHTKLNSEWSEVYIIYPKKVEISDLEQKAFLVPQYKWDNLKPFERHREAQLLHEGSSKIIDWTLDKVPFSEKILKRIIAHGEKNKQKYERELLDKINKNYVIKRIPPHVPSKLAGFTETARDYKIVFNTDDLEQSAEAYLVANVYLGDPSEASGNSFPNKRGELENTLIKFVIVGEKRENYIEDLNELKTKMGPEPRTIYQSYTKIYIKYTDGSKKIIRNVGDVGYFVGFSKDGESIILNSSSYTRSKKGKFIMDLDGNNFREYFGPLPSGHPIQRYAETKNK